MRRLVFWLSILVPAMAVVGGVGWGSFPLGIPGEWVWDRVAPTVPLWLALGPLLIAAALYVGFVWIGAQRVERSHLGELAAWLCGLIVCGFTWLWIAQEGAPENYQLSKAVWVLYFRGSSGYFSEAEAEAADLAAYLADYERKMAEGDVLHIGTHPPGLTVAFRLLLGLCRESPAIVDLTLAAQSDSTRAAFSAFDATSDRPQSLTGVERAVLWLATLLAQAGAVLTILPLFGLLRMTCSRRASWLAVAFWPTLPALAVFLPKADCLYPLPAMTFLWLWLMALAHRSRVLSFVAGITLWVMLMLSLAFLPIALVGFLAGFWMLAREPEHPILATGLAKQAGLTANLTTLLTLPENCRRLISPTCWGTLGFAAPCLATGWFLKLNVLRVWWLNFQNHAGFYSQFPRTYWKWLLVNPFEFAVAAGFPLTVLAIWSILRQRHTNDDRPAAGYDWPWLVTLCLLWLSGKNMGEVARLWVLFMPFLVWSAGPLFEFQGSESSVGYRLKGAASSAAKPSALFPAGELPDFFARNGWCIALAVQLVTTAAIVIQVAGFHYPITRS